MSILPLSWCCNSSTSGPCGAGHISTGFRGRHGDFLDELIHVLDAFIEGLHQNAFIAAVRALIVDIDRNSTQPIRWDADLTQPPAVRGARLQLRDHGDAGPESLSHFLY